MRRIFLSVLFCALNGFSQEHGETPKPVANYAGNGVQVSSYDFKSFESMLNRQDDTVYVINFWATWCAPCIKELPFFERINSEYKHSKVRVILVSLDMRKQVESNLLPFIAKKNLKSEVVHLYDPDANSWISKVNESWSGAIPATLIYSGEKRKFYEQSFTFEELENELRQFLK